ncbi:MAG: hypothetical protein KGN80_04555 [Acidobacteriota bacterium]|nr:hypothetical protein [Acidobacteriota bacterium]
MRKTLLIIIIAMLALGSAAWWLLRVRSAPFSLDESFRSFSADNLGEGRLFRYTDGGRPLRAIRWLHPTAGGIVVAQVLTQTDQQQIGIFQNGQLTAQMHVPRPEGVAEGFYRFAQLRDAVVVPSDVVVLLYRAQDPTSADVPLLIAMDLTTQSVRWSHRAAVERLTLALDQKQGGGKSASSVLGFGDKGELVRLPLALQQGEREGARAPHAAAQSIELPPEIQGVTDLVPTGSAGFLITHRMGLSAYLGEKGWNHLALPTPGPLGFVEPKSRLVASGNKLWWQPEPGRLMEVASDGTPVAMWDPSSFPLPAPHEKDAELLQLLGADAEGKLWFGLAVPTLLPPLANPDQPKMGDAKPEASAATEPAPMLQPQAIQGIDRNAWEAYLRQGLDRLYCWDPEGGTLKGASWTTSWRSLGPPSDFSIPMGDGALQPAAGGFLFDSGTQAWWLPLKVLPLAMVGQSGNALPPPELGPLVVKAPPSPMTDLSGLPGTPKPSTNPSQ